MAEAIITCRLCRRDQELGPIERRKLERSGALVKKDGTGQWRGQNYFDAEYVLHECEACKDGGTPDAPIALQMARIRAHVLAMEGKGVSREEAISYAVEIQMIRDEANAHPDYAAWLGDQRGLFA